MRKSIPLLLVMAAAVSGTTLAVSAHGQGWHGGHGHGQFMALKQLNLTDAQRASIKQIVQTSFAQNKTQRQALRQQREAFEAMTPDQVGYQSAAASLATAEGAATQQRVQQQASLRAQIYALLTPAQKAQYATLQTQQQARRAQWEKFKAANPVSNSAPTSSSAQ